MDKYEYKLKLEQIKNLVAAEDYQTAAGMADTINWKKVRNSNTLCMVGKIYEMTKRYDACQEVLLQAYDHSPIGRNIVSKLAEVAILAKHVEEAEEYYNEFLEIAPKDNMRYILAYEISCLKNEPLEDRIAILEELRSHEYTEKWAYELAVLYGKAQLRDKCVETCDQLILWFGDGQYVEKALDLKRMYQPLTPAQEEKYKQFRKQKGTVELELPPVAEHKNVIDDMTKQADPVVTASTFNTTNLQDELAKSMRQIMNATEKETVSDTMDNIKKIVSDIPYLNGEQEEDAAPAYDKTEINAQVDQSLKEDFHELLAVSESLAEKTQPKEAEEKKKAQSAQESIEEVLREWEKTRRAAEAAIAAAEQKKLELAKENALVEAGQIMERLKTLLPILSATPGEDLKEPHGTVAQKLAALREEAEQTDAEADGTEAADALADGTVLSDAKDAAADASDGTAAGDVREDDRTSEAAKAVDGALAEDTTPNSLNGKHEEITKPEETCSAAADDEKTQNADAGSAADGKAAGDKRNDSGVQTGKESVDKTPTDQEEEPIGEKTPAYSEEQADAQNTDGVTSGEQPISNTVESSKEQNRTGEADETAPALAKVTECAQADEEIGVANETVQPGSAADHETAQAGTAVPETQKMPDIQSFRAQNAAKEPEKEPERLSVVESVPDEELERMLAQATQMFVENANVEVPVTGSAPIGAAVLTPPAYDAAVTAQSAAAAKEPEILPQVQMPEDVAEETKKELTKEQKELFSYFLPVPGMEDQIRQILLGAKSRIGNSITSLSGNILIMGEEGSGKTVFATSLIKAIQKEVGNEDAKIGKISAESLNRKDFSALIPKIDGGYLIIDKAGELTRETAVRMSQLMEQNTRGMVVVLEDTRAGIRQAMQLDFGFANKFTEKVDIPIFTIDELVKFGKSYAQEMECTIDEMGVLALYNRINNIQKLDRPTTLAEIKDIVDAAIESAEGGGLKKLFAKKYDENDYLILREKDFE